MEKEENRKTIIDVFWRQTAILLASIVPYIMYFNNIVERIGLIPTIAILLIWIIATYFPVFRRRKEIHNALTTWIKERKEKTSQRLRKLRYKVHDFIIKTSKYKIHIALIIVLFILAGIAVFVFCIKNSSSTYQIPCVIGSIQDVAINTLQNQGFVVAVREEFNDKVTGGNIISQSPAAGSTQLRGSVVTIVVSLGRDTIQVPDVVRNTQSVATNTLQNQGFSVMAKEEFHYTVAEGNVISQSPVAGSSENRGSAVTIVVSRGRATVQVPNVVDNTQSVATNTLQNQGFSATVREEFPRNCILPAAGDCDIILPSATVLRNSSLIVTENP